MIIVAYSGLVAIAATALVAALVLINAQAERAWTEAREELLDWGIDIDD